MKHAKAKMQDMVIIILSSLGTLYKAYAIYSKFLEWEIKESVQMIYNWINLQTSSLKTIASNNILESDFFQHLSLDKLERKMYAGKQL